MSGVPRLLLPGGEAIADGVTSAIPAEGLALTLSLPAPRRLAEARLDLAAVPGDPAPIAPTAIATSEGGPPAGRPVRWVSITLPAERAVTGLRLTGDPAGAARLYARSEEVWRPLTPPDLTMLGTSVAPPVQVPPFAASQILAELQAPCPIGPPPPPPPPDKAKNPPPPPPPLPAPMVPAPVALEAVSLFGTDQPCRLAVSIGADPPFFHAPSPLPTAPVEVPGLLRAANRYLAETPGATTIPIRITAAAPASLRFATVRFSLLPEIAEETPAGNVAGSTAKPVEESFFPSLQRADVQAAQLCDQSHGVAQRVERLPAGQAIVSIGLYMQAGAAAVAGSVALHRGAEWPEGEPMPGTEVPLNLTAPGSGPGWVRCPLPAPLRLEGPVWAVCRVTAGEIFWFTAPKRPSGLGGACTRLRGGAWRPAVAPGAGGWAQLRLGLLPAAG